METLKSLATFVTLMLTMVPQQTAVQLLATTAKFAHNPCINNQDTWHTRCCCRPCKQLQVRTSFTPRGLSANSMHEERNNM
jgi:hypothetical protein